MAAGVWALALEAAGAAALAALALNTVMDVRGLAISWAYLRGGRRGLAAAGAGPGGPRAGGKEAGIGDGTVLAGASGPKSAAGPRPSGGGGAAQELRPLSLLCPVRVGTRPATRRGAGGGPAARAGPRPGGAGRRGVGAGGFGVRPR
ncbi:MAG: hypothetical protein K6T75_07435 [Acetobacteraceae bacterium]|nr:hypothetical protein [Acetobacteraceae bacterium]